jgi:hypothetical protein
MRKGVRVEALGARKMLLISHAPLRVAANSIQSLYTIHFSFFTADFSVPQWAEPLGFLH